MAASYASIVEGMVSESWLGPSSSVWPCCGRTICDLDVGYLGARPRRPLTRPEPRGRLRNRVRGRCHRRRGQAVTAASSYRWWRPTFSDKNTPRSQPPKPNTAKCGPRTPWRYLAMPARRPPRGGFNLVHCTAADHNPSRPCAGQVPQRGATALASGTNAVTTARVQRRSFRPTSFLTSSCRPGHTQHPHPTHGPTH